MLTCDPLLSFPSDLEALGAFRFREACASSSDSTSVITSGSSFTVAGGACACALLRARCWTYLRLSLRGGGASSLSEEISMTSGSACGDVDCGRRGGGEAMRETLDN